MLRRLGATLSAIILLSFILQALELELLSMSGLMPLDGAGAVALRLALLAASLWLWVGPQRGARAEG